MLSVATSGTGTGDASLTFSFGTPGSPELSSSHTITSGTFSAAFSHTYNLTLAPFESVIFDSSGDNHADASANLPPVSTALSSVFSSGSQNISTDEPITVTFSGSSTYFLAVAGANPPIENGLASYVAGFINDQQVTNGSKSVTLSGPPITISISPSEPFSSASSGTITAQADVVPEPSAAVPLALAVLFGFAYRRCFIARH
jgi:hypothetical protein